jgi:hypothetical protein
MLPSILCSLLPKSEGGMGSQTFEFVVVVREINFLFLEHKGKGLPDLLKGMLSTTRARESGNFFFQVTSAIPISLQGLKC